MVKPGDRVAITVWRCSTTRRAVWRKDHFTAIVLAAEPADDYGQFFLYKVDPPRRGAPKYGGTWFVEGPWPEFQVQIVEVDPRPAAYRDAQVRQTHCCAGVKVVG